MELMTREERYVARCARQKRRELSDRLSVLDLMVFWIVDALTTLGMLYVIQMIYDIFGINGGPVQNIIYLALGLAIGFYVSRILCGKVHNLLYRLIFE